MTDEEGKQAAKEILEGLRSRHPILIELYSCWRISFGDSAADAFQAGVMMGYKCAWDDQAAGLWPEVK